MVFRDRMHDVDILGDRPRSGVLEIPAVPKEERREIERLARAGWRLVANE